MRSESEGSPSGIRGGKAFPSWKGPHHRPRFSIEDLAQQLNLTLELDNVDYDRGLKTELFTEERLKRSVSAAAAKGR